MRPVIRILGRMPKADWFGFLILLTASASGALLANQLRDRPTSLVYVSKSGRLMESVENIKSSADPVSRSVAGLPAQMSLDAFKEYVNGKQGLVLDARPEIFHRFGHIPGALSLPRDDFETAYAGLREELERDRAQPLVVYCSSSSCEDSELVQQALVSLGYQQVSIFKGGMSEWKQAGLPEVAQ